MLSFVLSDCDRTTAVLKSCSDCPPGRRQDSAVANSLFALVPAVLEFGSDVEFKFAVAF